MLKIIGQRWNSVKYCHKDCNDMNYWNYIGLVLNIAMHIAPSICIALIIVICHCSQIKIPIILKYFDPRLRIKHLHWSIFYGSSFFINLLLIPWHWIYLWRWSISSHLTSKKLTHHSGSRSLMYITNALRSQEIQHHQQRSHRSKTNLIKLVPLPSGTKNI